MEIIVYHAHYMTSQVSRKTGRARCAYAVYISKEQKEELFRNAPLATGRVVLSWYDKAKREVCLRRAAPSETGHQSNKLVLYAGAKAFKGAKTAGMYYASFTSSGQQAGDLDLSFLFAQRAVTPRTVIVKGVPHLVWQLPTRDEVEAPRMRLDNKERLYNPEENPSSDVRYVTVKQYAKEHAEKVLDGGPRIGWGPGGKVEVRPYQNGTPAAAPTDKAASPLENLKITIARVNHLAKQIGGVELAVEAGKLRASVVTRVDL
ncbi:MAG: hypothetical protein E6Q97_03565 [Desulfurellales bacterium]|nr:MAG: hypothetical protein E6Q97_03565 [Desulfurellales bacterium]